MKFPKAISDSSQLKSVGTRVALPTQTQPQSWLGRVKQFFTRGLQGVQRRLGEAREAFTSVREKEKAKAAYAMSLGRAAVPVPQGKVFGFLVEQKTGRVVTLGEGLNALSERGQRVSTSSLSLSGTLYRFHAQADWFEMEVPAKAKNQVSRFQSNDVVRLEGKEWLLKVLPEKQRLSWQWVPRNPAGGKH